MKHILSKFPRVLFTILVLSSLFLTGCNATTVPTVSVSAMPSSLDESGYATIAFTSEDDSFDGFSGVCSVTDGSSEAIFDGQYTGPETLYIEIGKTTTIVVTCSNNVGTTMSHVTIEVKSSLTPSAEPVELNDCVFAGGHWFPKYNDGLQVAGYMQRDALVKGLPLQPYFHQINQSGIDTVTFNDVVMKIDAGDETCNDGGCSQLLACPDESANWHYFMSTREGDAFSLVSYLTCNDSGCSGREGDTGEAGTWQGLGSGLTIQYTEVTEEDIPSDLSSHWNMIQELIKMPAPIYTNIVITEVWHK